ncbi:Ribonuclease H1 [Halotydeus destructor]|nr:Ribonuclease H1 [Halotydeus destructor]
MTNKHAIVYTDGACSRNGKAGAKAGIGAYCSHDAKLCFSAPLKGSKQTNIRAEMDAAREAIQRAKDGAYAKITVRTDSEFLKKAIELYKPNWERNGWKTASGRDVSNKSDFEALAKASDGIVVEYEWIRGHAGHDGNERADQNAKKGARATLK